MAIATLPECRRPTCHELVAIGKNGEPLKDCETHRDKRPSSKARAAAKDAATVETLLATGEEVPDDQFGDPATESAEPPFTPDEKAAYDAAADTAIATARFGAPRPAPKPTARQKANAAISARLSAVPNVDQKPAAETTDAVVALRADRNQVIVTLTARGSTDAQSKAKYAARAAGHKVTGVDSISGGEAGSRKPSEWKVTLDLRAERKAKAGSIADFPVLSGGTIESVTTHRPPTAPPSDDAKALLGIEPSVHTRFHKGSGKFLAEAKVAGKTIFRYGADAESAERKMREHLATLG